jgi:hypothetical protein
LVPLPDSTLSKKKKKKGSKMKTKLLALGTLGLLSVLSLGKSFYNVNADLTAPTYDYAYKQDISNYWRVHNQTNNQYDNPVYTRSGASSPYDYTVTTSVELPFSVSMTFRKSDVGGWTSSGGGYRPGELFDSEIGSTNVANVVKVEFEFNNNTGDSYYLRVDMDTAVTMELDYTQALDYDAWYTRPTGNLSFYHVVIPAYTYVGVQTQSSTSTRKFNAWYLNKIDADFVPPTNESFNEGYDLGYENGWADGNDAGLSGDIKMAELMGTVMNGVGGIFSIAILGNITLGTLALFPLLGVMVFFFKKVIQ